MNAESPESIRSVRRPFWKRFWFWLAVTCLLPLVTLAVLMFWPGLEFGFGDNDFGIEVGRRKSPDRAIESFRLHLGRLHFSRIVGSNEIACGVYPPGWWRDSDMLVWTGVDQAFYVAWYASP